MTCQNQVLHNIAENTIRKVYGRYKDCLPVLCGEENADRNAAFNIAYWPLGYIYKVGVTVNLPKLKLT